MAIVNAKAELQKQQNKLAKDLKYLADAPIKEGAIKRCLAKGAEPLKEALQNEYLKDDPTKFGGKVSILMKVKTRTKSLIKIYVGPDTKYGQSWRLWQILQFGHILKRNGAQIGIVPGKRSIERAFKYARQSVIEETVKAYKIEVKKYAAKIGLK